MTTKMKDLQLHEVPETCFFYQSCRVSRDNLNEAVAKTMMRLLDLTQARDIAQTGNLWLVYRGKSDENDDTFELWIGLPVLPGTRPRDEFEVGTLPGFRCAASMHMGASKTIGETYGQLIEWIRGHGYEPTSDIREEYLHWEGRNSDRDITWVQVGVR